MSHLSEVIIIAVPPSDMKDVFDSIHNSFTKNHFEIEEGDFDVIVLCDIDTDDGKDYIFESESIYPASKEEKDNAIERLRNHRTGGLLNYRGIEGKFEGLPPYDIGVEFRSLDNMTIEYITITIRDYIFDPHETAFENLITTVLNTMNVIGIAKGLDYPYEWDEEEITELIKEGKLETVHPRLVYKKKY
ncbi:MULTISPECIES: hypothetical protein [Chryseobacterium]|uniref:hypothetical protein n=1 Tax=Chryseobacterium TaxID=59732 RepID=UPI001295EB06|nr:MULTISPECIES: hypothetical protein [Chryseobacterium]MDR6921954.1 hypothetical protein [Chryseobacterium sp. 2987]